MNISDLRKQYHQKICSEVIRVRLDGDKHLPNFADISNRTSVSVSLGIIQSLGFEIIYGSQKEQTTGDRFERITAQYIEDTFSLLNHLRPGKWVYSTLGTDISRFEQYRHLAILAERIKNDRELSTTLGRDYFVRPDIVVSRMPVEDAELNEQGELISEMDHVTAALTPLRESNQETQVIYPILHASISCKWTIRSDRSQNTRTEALNLIRNRKGNLPHIVAVTAEPLPTRIAALALGTGDLDCVYHFALPELYQVLDGLQNEDQKDMLNVMVDGGRLRDISDLPFDLAV